MPLGSSSSKKKPSPDDKEPAAPSHNLVIELHKKVQTDIIGFECVSISNAPPQHPPSAPSLPNHFTPMP